MKKALSLLMVLAMVAASCLALTSCGKKTEEVADADLKLGFIFLHDENSTYDKNFMDAAKEVQKELNLTDEQVIFKTNIPEGNECYEAAADLVDQGCNIVF
ncbi:MAG: BMP family ABC transporter substrate-binding protein, partial [Clostridia bacterium]|nr:BMP family ABC transporter substrate-binding protein [Clostridia bacterium]